MFRSLALLVVLGSSLSAFAAPRVIEYGQDANSAKIRTWLKQKPARQANVKSYLRAGHRQSNLANLIDGEPYGKLRQQVVNHFQIK